MSNYKDLAFTPAQKDALERFGESAEAYVLDKWFTPQQVRIIQLWSINHEQPENAHIFFNRLQCKYLTTLYKEVPSPIISIIRNEFLDNIVVKKSSIEKYSENSIQFLNGPSGILKYIIEHSNNGTLLLFQYSNTPAVIIYDKGNWYKTSSSSTGRYNFQALDYDSDYRVITITRDGVPTQFRPEYIYENSQLKNGIDFGKLKTQS